MLYTAYGDYFGGSVVVIYIFLTTCEEGASELVGKFVRHCNY